MTTITQVPSVQKTISPVDGRVYVERLLATPDAINEILRTARHAQASWRNVPIEERAKILSRFGVDLGEASEADLSFEYRLAAGARRFDLGNYNFTAAVNADCSLAYLAGFGKPAIEAYVLQLSHALARGFHLPAAEHAGRNPGLFVERVLLRLTHLRRGGDHAGVRSRNRLRGTAKGQECEEIGS